MATTVLTIACAIVALAGVTLAAYARDHVPHGKRPALIFGVPAALLAAGAAAAWVTGATLTAVPVTACAILFAAAAWTVVPTSRSRFAQFERHFWHHVRHATGRERTPS